MTASDFETTKTICPACGRPALVYTRGENAYLRCEWGDCRINASSHVPSMETFFRVIEEYETKENGGREE